MLGFEGSRSLQMKQLPSNIICDVTINWDKTNRMLYISLRTANKSEYKNCTKDRNQNVEKHMFSFFPTKENLVLIINNNANEQTSIKHI